MAQLIPFGATAIADKVKEEICRLLVDDDWDMTYSNADYGHRYKRNCGSTSVKVAGGDKMGVIEVTVYRASTPQSVSHYTGTNAVTDAAKQVLAETRY